MIYVYNSNANFKKQIEYVFMNIFYVLGLDYIFISNGFDNKLNQEDLLLAYTDEKLAVSFINKFKNIIIIKPSNKLFCEDYLKINSIPNEIRRYYDVNSIFSEDKDLYINEEFNDKLVIKTNIDIVSDIFFMLSRYEEAVDIKAYENEKYKRFSAGSSIAFKNGILDKPIVNEHIDLLWSFIVKFNLDYKKKNWWGEKSFAACLTHDIDFIQKYKKFKDVIKPSASLFFKNKKPFAAIKNVFNFFGGYRKDPYNTFDYIINLEKSYGFRSSFYFMSGGNSEFDNAYNIYNTNVKKLIQNIEDVCFEVGCHYSFNSYNDEKMIKDEKEKLDQLIKQKPYGGRQHYLRFLIPYTWRYQEKSGLLYDSTLSFADAEGFRCGTCFPFKPYDLLDNRIINIWEIPLIVMEGSLQNKAYRAYLPEKGLEETKKLIDTVKKHNGVFVMLYHNSSFDYSDILLDGWKNTYEETMKYLYENNCLGTSGREIIKYWEAYDSGMDKL